LGFRFSRKKSSGHRSIKQIQKLSVKEIGIELDG